LELNEQPVWVTSDIRLWVGVCLEGCRQMERLYLGIVVTSAYTLVTMALILAFIG
jgi:hypothetical protein